MRYLSICSGIEAASVAWQRLGWSPVGFSEIEPFPCALLSHRYPNVPNFGDMTKFHEWPIEPGSVDIIAGGTPCQGFSFAGLREGLDDPRSKLSLTYGEIAAKLRPRWLVWENVPGVLSSGGGADFAAILGILTGRTIPIPQGGFRNSGFVEGIDSAYGVAWVVRDAQYFGVPQRRRRVFLVGYLGDVRCAFAVLFERYGLQRHSPPRREAGKGVAGTLNARAKSGGGLGTDFDLDGGLIANALVSGNGHAGVSDGVPANLVTEAFGGGNISGAIEVAACLTAKGQRIDFEVETFITEPIGFQGGVSPSEGVGSLTASQGRSLHSGGLPCVAIPIDMRNAQRGEKALSAGGGIGSDGDPSFSVTQNTQAVAFNLHAANSNAMTRPGPMDAAFETETARCLDNSNPTANQGGTVVVDQPGPFSFHGSQDPDISGDVTHPLGRNQGMETCIAFERRMVRTTRGQPQEELSHCLRSDTNSGDAAPCVSVGMAVRRLTPRECERLMGFPDDYTLIPSRARRQLLADDLAYLFATYPEMTLAEAMKLAADCPRYKAIGNSWAVDCAEWIGRRIAMVEAMIRKGIA